MIPVISPIAQQIGVAPTVLIVSGAGLLAVTTLGDHVARHFGRPFTPAGFGLGFHGGASLLTVGLLSVMSSFS